MWLPGTSSRWQVTPGGSDQFNETSVHRPPSKQTQEEEVLCEAWTTQSQE